VAQFNTLIFAAAQLKEKFLRVFIIAKSKRHTRIYYYFKKAFQRQGHRTSWIKYLKLKSYLGERAATAAVDKLMAAVKPDLLFFHGRDISCELLQRVKKRMPVVMYYDDCIKGSQRSFDEVVNQGRLADIMYLTNRGEVARYRELGVNARFITGGCDPAAHRVIDSPDPMYQSDVAFIGKPNTPERTEFMQLLAKKFDLKLWGSGWEKYGLSVAGQDVYAAEYRQICAGAKIMLGWNIDPTIELYFSNRTWYTLGCGGFLLTAYSPALEEIFGRGRELDWFESIEECCEKIKYYLAHDEERRKIAAAGYDLAHREYSYDAMVNRIVEDVKKMKG
jgi:spore maturation protein CgeB